MTAAARLPFRVHYTAADGVTGATLVRAASPEQARKLFEKARDAGGCVVRKVKLDRSKEQS